MNIFFMNSVGTANWGGSEKWMLSVAEELRQRGHQIFFGGRSGSIFLERCQAQDFPILPLEIKGDFDPFLIRKLSHYFREHQIDIIVTHLNKDVRLAGIARRLSHVPVLVARNGLPSIKQNWRYRLTYPRLVDGIITNTAAIKNRYLSYGWFHNGYIRVIQNGIPAQPLPDASPEEVRAQYGLPQRTKIVGIFSRLTRSKQHNIFLEVAKNVLETYPHTRFLIVGDGPERERIQQYAFELGILDNVYMLGFQKNVLPLYLVCDLVLLTSVEEGMPNNVLEAMMMERPVIAFDVGGVSELIISEKNGILIPPNDIFLMSKRTRELLGTPGRRKAIGRAAREFVLQHYSLEKMIDNVEKYLFEIYKKKQGA